MSSASWVMPSAARSINGIPHWRDLASTRAAQASGAYDCRDGESRVASWMPCARRRLRAEQADRSPRPKTAPWRAVSRPVRKSKKVCSERLSFTHDAGDVFGIVKSQGRQESEFQTTTFGTRSAAALAASARSSGLRFFCSNSRHQPLISSSLKILPITRRRSPFKLGSSTS